MTLLREMNRPKISNDTDIDYSIWKVWVLLFVGVLAAFLIGYLFKTGYFVLAMVMSAILLIIFIFQSFFIKKFSRIVLYVFIEILTFVSVIAFFYRDFSFGILLTASILFYIFALLGHYYGFREAQNSLKINYFRIAYRVLPAAVTGLAILVGFFLGFSIDQSKLGSREYFEYFFRPISFAAGLYMPDFSPEMTAGNSITKWAEKILERQDLMNEINQLPEEKRIEIIEQSASEIKKNLESYIGSTIETELSVADNAYKIFRHRINDLFVKYPIIYISLVLALIIFFAIKTTAFFLYWLIALLGFIIYEILIVANFLTIRFESRDKEIVVLK